MQFYAYELGTSGESPIKNRARLLLPTIYDLILVLNSERGEDNSMDWTA